MSKKTISGRAVVFINFIITLLMGLCAYGVLTGLCYIFSIEVNNFDLLITAGLIYLLYDNGRLSAQHQILMSEKS